MTGRERVATAMRLGRPDRTPVMCQLALGHYFLHGGVDPFDVWYSSEGFGEALVRLQRRYGFDGILVNLPGREANWRRHARSIEAREGQQIIHWTNGWRTAFPADDLPWVCREDGSRVRPRLQEVDPADLFYVEPHAPLGARVPFVPGFDETRSDGTGEGGTGVSPVFPAYQYDTIKYVLRHAGDVSVHGEVFSPFSQLLELADHASVLAALLTDRPRVHACLERLAAGAAQLAVGQAGAGVDAVLVSSAFAGAGFISPAHYREFVLPYERQVVEAVHAASDIPVYTHTCGAIGDRLELMMESGTNGIDTLDPPPLGTVDFADARRRTLGRVFLKGNVDPVNVMLRGTPANVAAAAGRCLEAAGDGGGYILSTACAVAPGTPPENILALREAVDDSEAHLG